MFKDTKEGQTHYYNDGCGEPAHNKSGLSKNQRELLKDEYARMKVYWSGNELCDVVDRILESEAECCGLCTQNMPVPPFSCTVCGCHTPKIEKAEICSGCNDSHNPSLHTLKTETSSEKHWDNPFWPVRNHTEKHHEHEKVQGKLADSDTFLKAASELRPFMDKVKLPDFIHKNARGGWHKQDIVVTINKIISYLAAQEQKKV